LIVETTKTRESKKANRVIVLVPNIDVRTKEREKKKVTSLEYEKNTVETFFSFFLAQKMNYEIN